MKIADLGSYYQTQLSRIKDLADQNSSQKSLWAQEAQDLLDQEQAGFADIDSLLEGLHQAQRLNRVAVLGLENDQGFKDAVVKEAPASWKDFGTPPADNALQLSLAQKIYNAKPGDNAIIRLGDRARLIGPWLVEKALKEKVGVVMQFDDPVFNPLSLNAASKSAVEDLADDFLAMTATVNKRMLAVSGLPEKEVKADKDKTHLFTKLTKPFSEKVSSGDVFFTLTVIPTPKDAAVDGYDYKDFTQLFFEMCDQPWNHIDKAHRSLIKEFNAAKNVRITNNDGTDLTMDIDGFTFCNSLIAKNVPGSEIFSAPHRDSVNGTIVAKGRFEHNGQIIENLTLEFNKGKLVNYTADKGLEAFKEAVSVDEGALYVGELGIGTNPWLKNHVVNGLLVEKIGGSFHVALGRCYTMTDYMGDPVKVDNGNQSGLHWDITTMLYGKEGKIELDGRAVMEHGKFLDPKYDVLNRGWAAVPKKERPAYWQQDRKPPQPKP